MMYAGKKAKVFQNGKWSSFMPIEDALAMERTIRVEEMAALLRAGKTVISLRCEQSLLNDAVKLASK